MSSQTTSPKRESPAISDRATLPCLALRCAFRAAFTLALDFGSGLWRRTALVSGARRWIWLVAANRSRNTTNPIPPSGPLAIPFCESCPQAASARFGSEKSYQMELFRERKTTRRAFDLRAPIGTVTSGLCYLNARI